MATVSVAADLEHGGVLCLVAPAADGLDVALRQEVEHLAHVQVLLDARAEQLQAGVAGELLDLVAGTRKERREDGF